MSSSSDETEDEQLKELIRQRRKLLRAQRVRAKLERRRKKIRKEAFNIIAMALGDQRRISSTSGKEEPKRPTNLKRRLIELLKQESYESYIKAKQKNKTLKEKHIEKQKIGDCSVIKFGVYPDRTKEKEKREKLEDVTEERHSQLKETNTVDYNRLRKRSRKISKGLDKNGNFLKQMQNKNKPSTSKPLIPSKPQPILDIENLVQECANEFKCSIKNAIVKFVPETYALTKKDDISKSQGSVPTSHEMSAESSKCTRTQMADDTESQVSNRKLPKQPLRYYKKNRYIPICKSSFCMCK